MNKVSPLPSLTRAKSDDELAAAWLEVLGESLSRYDEAALARLFAGDSHWRDLLAFTWTITPRAGPTAIARTLIEAQPSIRATSFVVAEDRTPPRRIKRLGEDVIEIIFEFETATGRGHGIVRLLADTPHLACSLMTSLDELRGFEPRMGSRRPSGSAYSRTFGGDNWSDLRKREQGFEDRDPVVLVIGAGQAGLSTAARLRMLGVDTLVVDRYPRVGDVWRRRYHSLALHNGVQLNHLAHLPFPPHWPNFLPKDMVADWLETYAHAMECNVWSGSTFLEGSYDESVGHWSVRIRRADGSERILRPRHIVFANGVSGQPKRADLPGLDTFAGTVLHTHDFTSGAPWRGKRALVVGAGTSGHDVAQDLHGHGVEVAIVQRGSTTIASIAAAKLVHSVYYDEGLPLEDADLIATTSTYPMLIRGYQAAVKRMRVIDSDLLDGLSARGFKHDYGGDETGHQMKFRRRHGGYYLNCGCSELIVEGEIGLVQSENIERFVPEGALLTDGSVWAADLVVTASGYQSQQDLVGQLLGAEVADRIGPIWGIADDGELANMFRPTRQEGLWFIGGGLAHARIYSHYLAMQIKAREANLIP